MMLKKAEVRKTTASGPGGEHALEVAAEGRWVAVVRRSPQHLMDDRQHHAVGDADDREGEEGVGDPSQQHD